jgi:hypothetical protein
MAALRQSSSPLKVDAFASMQSYRDGARPGDGGTALAMASSDQARALWTVEAAPIGALTTFQLERDETTGQWIIRAI